MVRQDPKQTTEFFLGQIAADVSTIKERQEKIDSKIDSNNTSLENKIDSNNASLEKKIAAIQVEVDEIKRDATFNKGFLAAIATIGGTIGVSIVYGFKFILGFFVTH